MRGVSIQSGTLPPSGPLRLADKLLIGLFLAAIVAPLIDGWLRPSAERAMQAEHRRPNPKPVFELKAAALTEYPRQFNQWYGDSFGLRDKLVRAHNIFQWFGLGVSPTSTLVLGKDNWVEFTWFNTIAVYRGVAPLEPAELEDWRALLEYRRDWLAKRGIAYLFALAPVKAEIYPEKLPARFDRVGPTRRTQLMQYMREHSNVDVLDFTQRLSEERRNDGARDDEVYYRLGVHWTDRGILVGYQELIRHLQQRFPGMQPWSRADFVLQPAPDGGDSWAWRLYMEDLLPQHPFDLVPIRKRAARFVPDPDAGEARHRYEFVNENSGLPNCMVLGDSFSEPMSEFLAENFAHTLGYRNISIDAKTVEQDDPDVVIQLFNERCLVSQDPRNLLERARAELGPLDADVPPKPDRTQIVRLDPPTQFAAASDVRLSVDLSQNGPMLDAYGKSEIRRAERNDEGGLVIETHGATDGFYLPLFDFPASGVALLALDIESPTATALGVLDSVESAGDTSEAKARREVQLPAGRSKLIFDVVHRGPRCRLIVHPGRLPGRFILHSVEVRAAAN